MPVTATSGEYKSRVGLDSLYIAQVADSSSGYTADTPEMLAPAADAVVEPSTASETQYADDGAFDVVTSEGATKVTLTVTGVPLEMLAKLTGKRFDSTSGRLYDYGGTPPDIALSFRSRKSNGKFRYYQFLKGKFEVPKEEFATRGEKAEVKTVKLVYTAMRTMYKFSLGGGITDATKSVVGDEDTLNFSGTTWFAAVQTPAVASYSALALSSSTPADAATGVSVSANQTLTFNNALNADALTNVTLIKASDGVVITSVMTIDSARKVITIDPAAPLTAATAYIIVYLVKDVYGQTLAGAVNFTTA